MSGNTNYIDQVGAFLDNELSGVDLAKFNAELATNPELVKELNFQKELIEGIKDFRRSELKARLDNIPVSTGLWYGSAVKLITGALITAGIGFGIYELSQTQENNLPEKEAKTIIQTEQNQSSSKKEESTPVIDEKQDESANSEDIREESVQEKTITKKEKTAPVPKAPKVLTPESFEMDQPSEDDLDIPETTLGSENELLESQLEIEIITNKRKYPFHYQVIEGRLLLYGDFDEEPYELLEISINSEKKLYLFFKDKYYEIEKSASEVTPLQVVTNRSLITELNKLKNKDS